MFIDHNSYSIPGKIGPIKIKPLSWKLFKSFPPENSPYLAHIYWAVNYEFAPLRSGQPKVKVTVSVLSKSWKVRQSQALLRHEYGHYLIGCLCGLSFAKKINFGLNWNKRINFGVWCNQVLSCCLKQYCRMEKLYDQQTKHYLDEQMQMYWQNKIRDMLNQFNAFFKHKNLQLSRKNDRNTNESNQNKSLKIENGSSFKKRLSLRKAFNNQAINNQQFFSKGRLKNKAADQQKYDKSTQVTTFSSLRFYKRLASGEFTNKIPNTNSFLVRPKTTGLKFF